MVKWDDYFKEIALPNNDKLEVLFEEQKKLMDRYNMHVKDINTLEGQNLLRQCGMRLFEEIGEIFHCLKNKDWVANQTEVDKKAMYDEVADVWHFFIELMILMGLTPDDCIKLYLSKSKVNHKRIDTQY